MGTKQNKIDVRRVLRAGVNLCGSRLTELRTRVARDIASGREPHIELTTKMERAEYIWAHLIQASSAVHKILDAWHWVKAAEDKMARAKTLKEIEVATQMLEQADDALERAFEEVQA